MTEEKKTRRSTIYLDMDLHKALRHKSAEVDRSLSELVNDAVRHSLAEDADDLAVFRERASEPVVTFENVLKELKKFGRL